MRATEEAQRSAARLEFLARASAEPADSCAVDPTTEDISDDDIAALAVHRAN